MGHVANNLRQSIASATTQDKASLHAHIELARRAVEDEGWFENCCESEGDASRGYSVDCVTIFFIDENNHTDVFVLFTLLSSDKTRHHYELVYTNGQFAITLDQIINNGIEIKGTLPLVGEVDVTGNIHRFTYPSRVIFENFMGE